MRRATLLLSLLAIGAVLCLLAGHGLADPAADPHHVIYVIKHRPKKRHDLIIVIRRPKRKHRIVYVEP